jgi:hypothetical protein
MMVSADVMHRCGVSGIAEGDQQAQGQSKTHLDFLLSSYHRFLRDVRYDRDRRAGIRGQTNGELVTAARHSH